MHEVYLISDMHFGHDSIIKYENRSFTNTEEMNKTIINNWNNIVKQDDKVFVLGDVSVYNKEKTTEIIKKLNGYKFLILGNHDKVNTISWWREVGFDEVVEFPIIYDDFFILSHEPLYLSESMPYANIHGHIHHLKYDSKQFFNVSVECINYTPIKFEDVKKAIMD